MVPRVDPDAGVVVIYVYKSKNEQTPLLIVCIKLHERLSLDIAVSNILYYGASWNQEPYTSGTQE